MTSGATTGCIEEWEQNKGTSPIGLYTAAWKPLLRLGWFDFAIMFLGETCKSKHALLHDLFDSTQSVTYDSLSRRLLTELRFATRGGAP